jgi:hypothetical protein
MGPGPWQGKKWGPVPDFSFFTFQSYYLQCASGVFVGGGGSGGAAPKKIGMISTSYLTSSTTESAVVLSFYLSCHASSAFHHDCDTINDQC